MTKGYIQNLSILLFGMVVLCSASFFLVKSVYPYFAASLPPGLESQKWWLVAHFTGATCALFLGPLQFWPYFRHKYWKWHRIAGKFYIGSSVVSALMVFYLLSNYALPGAIPSLGFLAIIWLFTTVASLRFALRKNFKLHRDFMIRSYVCSLAFVFIRLLPYIDECTGVFSFIENDEVRWTIYEWICWVYPLLITEFILSWRASLLNVKTIK
jgi:uncharacterized membrane protein